VIPVALVASAFALTTVVLLGLLVRSRRRAQAVTRRRVVALEGLATTIERLASDLERQTAAAALVPPPPAPAERPPPAIDPATGLPARAALVDALGVRVAEARRDGGRLGLAVVAVGEMDARVDEAVSLIANAARETAPDTPAFRAGERAVALLLPDAGRADAIAAVAKIEAALKSGPAVLASVVELESGEDAVALLARASGRAPE
jgi:predicted signal transduction protein with EAL and GGDEF domain